MKTGFLAEALGDGICAQQASDGFLRKVLQVGAPLTPLSGYTSCYRVTKAQERSLHSFPIALKT